MSGVRWVTSSQEGQVFSPCPFSDTNLKVCVILDPHTHGWREDVLREVLPFGVENTCNVSVSTTGGCDQRFWAESCDGILRVRHVYKMGRRYKEEEESS